MGDGHFRVATSWNLDEIRFCLLMFCPFAAGQPREIAMLAASHAKLAMRHPNEPKNTSDKAHDAQLGSLRPNLR